MLQKIKNLSALNLFKQSGIVFVLRMGGMFLSYVAILIISNYFGAEVYGRYSLSLVLLQFLVLIFSLGLTSSTVKLTADINFFQKKKPLNRYLLNSIILLIASTIVCSLFVVVFKDKLAIYLFKDKKLIPYFNYISIFVVFAAFHAFIAEFIRARHKFVQYGIYLYVMPYVLLIAFLLLTKYLNYDESFTFLSYLLSLFVLSLIMLWYLPGKSLFTKNIYGYKALLSLSFPMMFSAAFIFISNWTDIFMLGAMVSKSDVGIYNAAYKLAILALVVVNAVNTVLAPKISDFYSKNRLDKIETEVQKATKIISIVTIPIVIILILFRKQLLGLFGPEFVQGQTALVIISLGLLFNALSGSVGQVLNMTKHQKQLRLFTLISALANILLNFVLIKRMGITGAAIASLMSNIVLNVLCIIYIKKKLGFYAFIKL